MAALVLTPRKSKFNCCVVCGTADGKNVRKRFIHSGASVLKNLPQLLEKYGRVKYVDGFMCRNCEERLRNIDRRVEEFQEQCSKTAVVIAKRLPHSPGPSSPTTGQKAHPDQEVRPKLKRSCISLQFESEGTPSAEKDTSAEPLQFSPETSSSFDESLEVPSSATPLLLTSSSDLSLEDVSICEDGPRTSTPHHASTLSRAPVTIYRRIAPKPVPISDISNDEHSYEKKTQSVGQKSRPKQKSSIQGLSIPDHDYITGVTAKDISIGAALQGTCLKETVTKFVASQDGKHLTKSDLEWTQIRESVKDENFERLMESIASSPVLLESVMFSVMRKEAETLKGMGHRKKGDVSCLMKKDYAHLTQFNWLDIVEEGFQKFPELMKLAVGICGNRGNIMQPDKLQSIIPKLGLVYAILAQEGNKELSLVQRVISLLLHDNICDQKVFDRLQRVGLGLCYYRSLNLLNIIGDHYDTELIEWVKRGKKFRLCGDNINWKTGVAEERLDKKGHMQHAFGTIAILQNAEFGHLDADGPQALFWQQPVQTYILSSDEWDKIRDDYVILMGRVAARLVPVMQFINPFVKHNITGPYSEVLSQKSKVIPLPVQYRNEQYYADVVEIMDEYEDTIKRIHERAGIEAAGVRVHIGGDQLTRERFSGAKRLRIGAVAGEDRFQHLSPITFELFHMLMNFLMLIVKHLYSEDSGDQIGTMKAEQTRISRTSFESDVRKAYDADRDFTVSFIDAYIVEAILEYFGMQDIHSAPTQHIPPATEQREWFWEHFRNIVDKMVAPDMHQHLSDLLNRHNGDNNLTLVLANGQKMELPTSWSKTKPDRQQDGVRSYGHKVLELGLFYKDLMDLVKVPDRDRGIRLLKLAMIVFKADKNLSKYALEIARLLVHQLCSSSVKEAHEEFYGLFVNTSGKIDGHVAADERMEWQVHVVKKHLKHMYSDKTEKNIVTRSKALAGIQDVAVNYDASTCVITRQRKHMTASSLADEIFMINDLRRVRPFSFVPGRAHRSFMNISQSVIQNLDPQHFRSWLDNQQYRFATELGN